MTIKEIKAQWSEKAKINGLSGKKQFTVWSFTGYGKCVVVVVNDPHMERFVVGVVPVSTGIDVLADHARPCDNMDDAIDVAGEILSDMWSNGELEV